MCYQERCVTPLPFFLEHSEIRTKQLLKILNSVRNRSFQTHIPPHISLKPLSLIPIHAGFPITWKTWNLT